MRDHRVGRKRVEKEEVGRKEREVKEGKKEETTKEKERKITREKEKKKENYCPLVSSLAVAVPGRSELSKVQL